jgi:hypothetical protein
MQPFVCRLSIHIAFGISSPPCVETFWCFYPSSQHSKYRGIIYFEQRFLFVQTWYNRITRYNVQQFFQIIIKVHRVYVYSIIDLGCTSYDIFFIIFYMNIKKKAWWYNAPLNFLNFFIILHILTITIWHSSVPSSDVYDV